MVEKSGRRKGFGLSATFISATFGQDSSSPDFRWGFCSKLFSEQDARVYLTHVYSLRHNFVDEIDRLLPDASSKHFSFAAGNRHFINV